MTFWFLLISISFVICSHHESNWAVLVCSSRGWLNYRHVANTLSLYRTVKRLGIPDRNIILMLADDIACNSRNPYPSRVYNTGKQTVDLYGSRVETDYRGHEVSVENFIRVLTGRHEYGVPRSKRMLSDERSNILIYITGHGGNEFLKFQGTQDIMAQDLADAIAQMHEKGRYREMLLMIDTCEAETMYSKVQSPNVIAISSSIKGESSYSQPSDPGLGVSLVDRFTSAALDFFEGVNITSNATLSDLVLSFKSHDLLSTWNYNQNAKHRRLTLSLLDFFGHVPLTRVIHTISKQKQPLLRNADDTNHLMQEEYGTMHQKNRTVFMDGLQRTALPSQQSQKLVKTDQSTTTGSGSNTEFHDIVILLLVLLPLTIVLFMDWIKSTVN